jgi:hypothetical protein
MPAPFSASPKEKPMAESTDGTHHDWSGHRALVVGGSIGGLTTARPGISPSALENSCCTTSRTPAPGIWCSPPSSISTRRIRRCRCSYEVNPRLSL